MSAYLVDKTTIHKVVWVVDNYTTDKPFSLSELGRRLLKMNGDALVARYGTDDGAKKEGRWYEYVTPPHESQAELVALYAGCRCFLYQCTEGNVPKRRLYRQVWDAANELAFAIVGDLPGWEWR